MITEFRDEHAFLSNFWPFQGKRLIGPPAPILWKGISWPSAEHLFQAGKTTSGEVAEWIRQSDTPGMAKSRGRAIEVRPDWNEIKLDVMLKVVTAKFMQNPDLAEKLVATGDEDLIEGNWWGDKFWGIDLKQKYPSGENWLGRLLMILRAQLVMKADLADFMSSARVTRRGELVA